MFITVHILKMFHFGCSFKLEFNMQSWILTYLILLSILSAGNTPAQGRNYTFRHITVEDGLSQSTITNILQDRKGYMWFGTGNGLNKYNGYSFVVFSNIIDDPLSISSNAVTSMFEDAKGILWIGTVDGILNCFNRKTETFTRFHITSGIGPINETDERYFDFPLSYSRNNSFSITAIAGDDDGNLWIGTWGKGVLKFNPEHGTTEHYFAGNDSKIKLSNNKITCIKKSSDGAIWILSLIHI